MQFYCLGGGYIEIFAFSAEATLIRSVDLLGLTHFEVLYIFPGIRVRGLQNIYFVGFKPSFYNAGVRLRITDLLKGSFVSIHIL